MIKFKSNEYYINKKKEKIDLRPPLFDASGKIIQELAGLKIGNGSLIKVNCTPVPFFMPATSSAGVTLRINAVQIIELKGWGTSDKAEDYGFGAEEGGFQIDEEEGAGNEFFSDNEESEEEEDTESGDF